MVISARAARMSSEPCVMCTSPDSTLTLSPANVPLWCCASVTIGWLRSVERASAGPAKARAAATSRRLAERRDIAGTDLREEFVAPRVECDLQTAATQYRAGLGDGHDGRGAGVVVVGEDGQLFGSQGDPAVLFRRAGAEHAALQADAVAAGTHPAAPRLHLPV